MARRIVGNLDCESDYAATPRRPSDLPARVLAPLSQAATLLRVFAQEDDRLWLPAPIDPAAIIDVPEVPKPILESGPLEKLPAVSRILAWGETATTAAERRRTRGRSSSSETETQSPGDGAPHDLAPHDLAWHLPASLPAVARKINHRGFCLQSAKELDCALPGAQLLASPNELDDHLAATSVDRWVLKAPYSAAGRLRYIHRGGSPQPAERQIARLFEGHTPLLFEPWMQRTADFGCSVVVTAQEHLILGVHRLDVDPAGRFLGLELQVGEPHHRLRTHRLQNPWLDSSEQSQLASVIQRIASRLRSNGYLGPFGLDCWRYRQADGQAAFHPLGEINGRMTFGLVARAWVERLRRPFGLSSGDRVRLVFGRVARVESVATGVPLFATSQPSPRAIWLEIKPAHP